MDTSRYSKAEFAGQGRFTTVFLAQDDKGLPLAQKVFTGDSASKLVLFLLTGSASPCTWRDIRVRRRVRLKTSKLQSASNTPR